MGKDVVYVKATIKQTKMGSQPIFVCLMVAFT